MDDQIDVIAIHDCGLPSYYRKLAETIAKDPPEHLVFFEYKPNPSNFLKHLAKILPEEKLPLISIHIYGDFLLELGAWLSAEEELKKFTINWYTASDEQGLLLKRLIINATVRTCPFPVDTSEFYFDQKLRDNIRRKLSIPDDAFVFLYTGRLSYQKNILELIQIFGRFLEITGVNAYLVIAGPFDNIGQPYLGIIPELAFGYRYKVTRQVSLVERVKILHNQDRDELQELYSGGDCYISFSTHNDEDFGMAPAEAAATGLPLILTKWGGFTSFKKRLKQVELVNTCESRNKIIPKTNEAISAMTKVSFKPNERASREKRFEDYFSVEAVTKIIRDQVEYQKFSGFTPLLSETLRSFKVRPLDPFAERGASFNSNYRDVYKGTYWSENETSL